MEVFVQQGTSIRGHKDGEGNLKGLLKYRIEDISVFTDWLKCSSYKSLDIISELI